MKDVFSEKELVDLEYFIKDMGIKVGYDSQNFAVTNGCATYYLYLDGFEQRTCLFKPSYFGRNPKGNWIAVDFIIGKNGNCVLGTVRNIDPSVAKNSSNYSDFYKGYVGKYWKFDVPHDFFDYMNESKKSARKSIKEAKVMSYDEFKKIVKKEFTKDEIESFGKTNNGYGVYVIAYGEKEIEIMCDDLRQYGFECKWWHSSDPEDDEPIYFIEAIPIMNESKKYARKSIKEYNYDSHNKSWVSDSVEKVYTNGLEYKNDWCTLSLYKDEYENLVNYLLDEKGFILEKKYTKKLGYDVFINEKLDLYVVIINETTYGFFDEKHFIIRFGDELGIETPSEFVEKTLKGVLFETFNLTKNDVDLIKSTDDFIILKTKESIDKKLLDNVLNDELSKYHYPISVEVEEGKDESICIIWVS